MTLKVFDLGVTPTVALAHLSLPPIREGNNEAPDSSPLGSHTSAKAPRASNDIARDLAERQYDAKSDLYD